MTISRFNRFKVFVGNNQVWTMLINNTHDCFAVDVQQSACIRDFRSKIGMKTSNVDNYHFLFVYIQLDTDLEYKDSAILIANMTMQFVVTTGTLGNIEATD